MIASIIWKPFDVKFGDIIERMSNHRQFIMDELKIMAARHAKSAYKTGELEMLLARNESRQMEDMKRAQELSKEMGEMRRRVEQEFRGKRYSQNEILCPISHGQRQMHLFSAYLPG